MDVLVPERYLVVFVADLFVPRFYDFAEFVDRAVPVVYLPPDACEFGSEEGDLSGESAQGYALEVIRGVGRAGLLGFSLLLGALVHDGIMLD